MATTLTNILIYSSLAGLATIIGILMVNYMEKTARKYSHIFISFAAGVLMAAAFLHLIPESMELNPNGLALTLLGFLIFYLLEHFIVLHCYHEADYKSKALSRITVLGIGLHSLIDGIAIGIGFEISQSIGLITTVAVILHELPEGITTLSILFHTGIEKTKALIYSFAVALATPIGAILTYFFINRVSESFLGSLLALAAGSFVYIAASDLVPETHEKFSKFNAFILLLGVVFVFLVGNLLG